MAVLVLAAAVGWGVYQSTRTPSRIAIPEAPLPSPEPTIEPEPPPPQAVVQMQEGSGEVNFAPAAAVLQGKIELQPVGTQEVLIGFTSADASAQWQFRLVLPGFFDLEVQYATAPEVEAVELTAELAGQPKALALRPTGSLDEFYTDTFTLALPKSGQQTLVLKPAASLPSDGLILKSVRLIPVNMGFDGPRTVPAGERGASAP
jgi:hypothetical protein